MVTQTLPAPQLRLAVGWMTLFVVGTDLFVVSPLLPTLAYHFTVTPSVAGWSVTAFSVLYAVGAPWWGARADRVGKRPLILWGLIGFSVANILTSVVPTFGLFVGSRMLAGFATAAIVPSIYALIADVAPSQHRGHWLSIVGSGLLISLWAGAPLGALVARWAGWPVVFLSLSISTATLVVANWWVWPQGLAIPEVSQVSSTVGTPWRPLLRDVTVTGFWAMAVYGFYTYLGTGLQRVDHLATGLVATVFAAYGIGATVGSLSGGRLADRFGAQRMSTVGLFGLGGFLVLIGFLFRSTILLYPMMLFFAWAAYAFFPSFQSLLAERYPGRRGRALAWNNGALYSGIALGAWLGGWVMSRWPFPVLPILCGTIALLTGLINRERRKG